jgi:hypothetical protein
MAAKSGAFCSRHVLVLQVKHGTEGTDPDMVKQHQPPPSSVNPARGPATVLVCTGRTNAGASSSANHAWVIFGWQAGNERVDGRLEEKQETEYVRLPIEAEG